MGFVEHDMYKCCQCYLCIEHCSGHALDEIEGIMIYSTISCISCGICQEICENNSIIFKS